MSHLDLVVVKWPEARSFCRIWHRHHSKPPPGHVFCTGVAAGDVLVGVAIVGRPVSSVYDNGQTLEVNRTVTDGHPNANSMLYGAVARVAFGLGYRRVITYTQEGESGASLRASGWKAIAERPPRGGWRSMSRPQGYEEGAGVARTLWEVSS